jgi:hypothetical protein
MRAGASRIEFAAGTSKPKEKANRNASKYCH